MVSHGLYIQILLFEAPIFALVPRLEYLASAFLVV